VARRCSGSAAAACPAGSTDLRFSSGVRGAARSSDRRWCIAPPDDDAGEGSVLGSSTVGKKTKKSKKADGKGGAGVGLKSGKKRDKKKNSGTKAARHKGLLPKKKCCVSKPRCRRCPLRMLAEGTLPPGLTVRHRRVVAVGPTDRAPAE
jgi:hypothetical protein